MELLTSLLEWLQPYGTQSYWLMFTILIACGFGFPMPEDVILVSGGILAAAGIVDYWTTQFVCMAGVILGDGCVFNIGRTMGMRVKNTWLFKRLMSPEMDQKVERIFARYGDKVIFMGRFMPGLRMPVFMTAGIYRVPPLKFFGLDGLAALISVPLWIWLGYWFGDSLEELHSLMKRVQGGVLLVVVLAVVILVFWIKKKSKDGFFKAEEPR